MFSQCPDMRAHPPVWPADPSSPISVCSDRSQQATPVRTPSAHRLSNRALPLTSKSADRLQRSFIWQTPGARGSATLSLTADGRIVVTLIADLPSPRDDFITVHSSPLTAPHQRGLCLAFFLKQGCRETQTSSSSISRLERPSQPPPFVVDLYVCASLPPRSVLGPPPREQNYAHDRRLHPLGQCVRADALRDSTCKHSHMRSVWTRPWLPVRSCAAARFASADDVRDKTDTPGQTLCMFAQYLHRYGSSPEQRAVVPPHQAFEAGFPGTGT